MQKTFPHTRSGLQNATHPSRVPIFKSHRHHGHKITQPSWRIQSSSTQEQTARRTADYAVEQFVTSNSVVGVSHGNMGIYTIQSIASRLDAGSLKNVQCVTSSDVASVEAAVHGIPLSDLQDPQVKIAVTFVEADALDCQGDSIDFITGRAELSSDGESFQHPQLTQLRRLFGRSRSVVALVSSEEKVVSRLGGSLPVVISSEDWEQTAEDIDDLFIGDAEIWRRSREQDANPRGGRNPYMSEEGHSIVDIKFITTLKLNGVNVDYKEISDEISNVKGVIMHGLFLGGALKAVLPSGDDIKIVQKELTSGVKGTQ